MSMVLQDCHRLLVQRAGGVGRVAPWACPPRTGRIKGPVPRVQSCGPEWERIQMRVESRGAVCLHRVTPTPIRLDGLQPPRARDFPRVQAARGRATRPRSWRAVGRERRPIRVGLYCQLHFKCFAAAREWVSPSPRTRVANACAADPSRGREERSERRGTTGKGEVRRRLLRVATNRQNQG